MKTTKYLILASSILLGGCGFTMQNGTSLPKQLQTLTVQADNPYSGLAIDLRQNLLDSGITLTPNAPVILKITDQSFTHDNPNMVSSAQATIYTFTYQANFVLYDKNYTPIIAPQTVSTNHTITLNPNEILDSNNKTLTLRKEMRREIIFKIFDILSARNCREALSTKFSKTPKTRT
ncbi:MAG: hypothetical protein JXR42_05700 [Gammaproteobacteria bacterium]|nr:hypothetical protein [Gammaproteobacteria bacterium]